MNIRDVLFVPIEDMIAFKDNIDIYFFSEGLPYIFQGTHIHQKKAALALIHLLDQTDCALSWRNSVATMTWWRRLEL